MTIIRLTDNVTLRPQQVPFFQAHFDNDIKHIIGIAHRRFGKGLCFFTLTLCAALKKQGVYGYLLPTIGQARRVIWQTIASDGTRLVYKFPHQLVAKIHESEQVITLINGSKIYVTGSDNYRRLVGMDFCWLVWDEFQDTNPAAVDALRPMITRNKGTQIFAGTPRAYNHFGELYHAHKDDESWYCTNLTINDTTDEFGEPIITQADIELERANGMPEELIQQEYYGSFDAAIRGAYFSIGLQKARADGRIGSFPANPNFPIYTGWDLGWDDSMTIWFVQVYDGKIFLVDYIEDRNQGMEHYTKILKDKTKGFRRAIDWAPHDIEVHELGPGKSRKSQAREMGVMFRTVQKPAKKMHGIQVIRYMFDRFHFNEKTVRLGLKRLTEYRPDYNEQRDRYSDQPMQNGATHGADALQTFCLGWMKAFEETTMRKQFEIANLYGSLIW